MRIELPSQDEELYIEGKNSLVLIGANGAGKTRLSVWIDEHNPNINIHRVSAQKSLNMPSTVNTSEMGVAEDMLNYGTTDGNKDWLIRHAKRNNRWGNSPETFLLNDYAQLMVYLMTESYEKSLEYREKHKQGEEQFNNETKLEKIKRIWEGVISHKKLKICAGKIEVMNDDAQSEYNGSEMSDGERAIFYFIGEALSVKKDSLIIIDEPENHLHKAILARLWNAIEAERPDCVFLYITHDLNFASSRVNCQVIWVKKMIDKNHWEYELVDDVSSSEELRLEIMGSRQKILLVEGTRDKSIDRKLYERVFKEYNIIPLESCQAVIQATKAYKKTAQINHVEIKGIVDRDRRNNDEIQELRLDNIFVPKVAEIENLFMLPEVIEMVARKLSNDNAQEIINQTKEKTFEYLTNNMENQAMLFIKQYAENYVNTQVSQHCETLQEYKTQITNIPANIGLDAQYAEYIKKLQRIIDERDYLEALGVINNKGLIAMTRLSNQFGWTKDYYINQVLQFISSDDDDAKQLINIIKRYISIDYSDAAERSEVQIPENRDTPIPDLT